MFGILIWTVATVAQIHRLLGHTQRKLDALLLHFQIEPLQRPLPSDRVKELARDPGRKAEAIRVYREETGLSLAEAKSAIETFIKNE
jgi:hypothetical protein